MGKKEEAHPILVLVIVLLAAVVFLASSHTTAGQSVTGTVGLYVTGFCTGPIYQGWNLVSLCNNATNLNIASIFAGIDYRYVMRWNETGQEFGIFSPSAATNPFTAMEVNRSYFVYLNSATASITPSNGDNSNMNITLVQGWNTPAWPYNGVTNFTRYFNSSFRYHMKWNATTQEFVIWSPRMSAPPPSQMFVGDGQFIYADVTTQLRLNRTNLTG